MIGPRSMALGPGAGTSADPSSSGPAEPGGYDGVWSGGGGGGNGGQADLHHRTSAKRLIDRYERLTTPPPGAGAGAGGATPTRNKSTKNRQYVYDYRMEAGLSNYLATPERPESDTKRRYGLGGGGGGRKETVKERSPLRQSLRNLLSVIKKGAGGLAKRKSEEKIVAGSPYGSGALGRAPATRTEVEEGVDGGKPAKPPVRPHKKMSGSLLYLTHPNPSPLSSSSNSSTDERNIFDAAQPEWTSCGVALDANKLVLSSFTGAMELHVHEISLARCADIRSVGAGLLNADEARLLEEAAARLEGENGGLKVFEVIFEGRPKERFAARSVRERAGWISAIWDAILPDNDAQGLPSEQEAPPVKETSISQLSNPIQSPVPRHIPEMSSLLSPSRSERSLPALPIDSTATPVAPLSIPEQATKTKPPNLYLDLSGISGPISPSLYPPSLHMSSPASSPTNSPLGTPKKKFHLQIDTSNRLLSPTSAIVPLPLSASTYPATSRPGSLFLSSPTSSSCPASPSIANLSQLSVVRQRLAQIERNHSQLSVQSAFSPRVTSRPSTPFTVRSPPVSPSAWREAFLSGPTPRASPNLPTPKALSPVASKERGELHMPVTRTRRQHKQDRKDDDDTTSIQTKHREKKIKEKALLLKEDVLELSKGLSEIKGVLGGEPGYPTIHQIVVGLDHRVQGDGHAFKIIQDRLDLFGDRVTNALASSSASPTTTSAVGVDNVTQQALVESNEKFVRALEEVKARLGADLPALANKIKEVRDVQDEVRKASEEREVVYNNIAASKSSETAESKNVDLQPFFDKLEELRKLLEARLKADSESKGGDKQSEHIEKILSLIQADSNKRVLLSQQQADSVRYLNELNTWLESFVNNGVSQIQGLSANIEQLCRNLGCDPQTADGTNVQEDQVPSLLNDIRHLVFGMKARDQNFAALQATVHSLLEVLSASQNQMGADSRAIAGMIDQQRRDQEMLFRTFTNEISGEIKGERLRFVEAMKEATAINVQIHVEQFKQELGKEVMSMTHEVGRLHQEKQHIENQISDLFAFYSKHRQNETPSQATRPSSINPNKPEMTRTNIPRSSNHRPLPYPRQQ